MTQTNIKPIELTTDENSKWRDTLALFRWTCPGFQHLVFKLLSNNDGDYVALMTRDVPVAATDGKNIMINPDTFLTLGLKERVFVLAHEVIHNVYRDPDMLKRVIAAKELRYADGTVLPFDNNTLQAAMDYRINAALVNSRIGVMPTGKFAGCYDETIATANDAVYDIYRKIYESDQGGKGTGQSPGFDQVMVPGSSTGQDPNAPGAQQNPQAWATGMAVAQILEANKSQGRVSADLQRMFDMYLKPQVPWTDHIQGFFARKLGSGSYSWRRPDRRLIVRDIYAPGRSGFGVNWVCVWGDTSGSIGPKELDTYFAELASMIEDLKPRRVTVFWCDSQIKHTDDLTDGADLQAVRARGVGGGGGTSCVPVFEAIQNMGYEPPDAFVGLTDGMACYPAQEPSYPTVWACTTDHPIPFGEVVRINVGEQ